MRRVAHRIVPRAPPRRRPLIRAENLAAVAGRWLETGGITVSELTQTGELSPMNTLMVAQKPTPLEMFLAIAPSDRPVPVELEKAHVAYAAANQRDPSPRTLKLDPPLARSSCILDPNCYQEYQNLAADCSLDADRDWFDLYVYLFEGGGFLGESAAPGSSWNEYGRTDGYSGESSASPKTVSVMSHLCNDGPSGTKIHRMTRSQCGSSDSGWSYMIKQ